MGLFSKTEAKAELQVFALFDTKAGAYGNPVFVMNEHTIIRDLSNLMRDPREQQQNQLYLNAEDFQLFRIGSYDKASGKLQAINAEHIANLHDLKSMIQRERPAQDPGALLPT